jgi:NAD(P)-dependent dehydrogenase (short-subunit alcohol dehydrogenase family)
VSEREGVGTAGNALIVGAFRGLGFAIVEQYLERGWSVVATRLVNQEAD